MNRRSLEQFHVTPRWPRASSLDAVFRWLPRVSLLTAIAASSALVTTWLVRPRSVVPVQVPLTQGITSGATTPDDDLAFNDRVRRSFPIGMPDRQMGRILFGQGFRRTDWSSSAADEHDAVREEITADCDRGYYVYWRVDSAGNLTDIRGEYSAACR